MNAPAPARPPKLDAKGEAKLRQRAAKLCRRVGDARAVPAGQAIPGEPLRERLERGLFSVEEARSLAKELCSILAAAHARGVVHGRLSAALVHVTEEGAVIAGLGVEQALRKRRPDDRDDVRAVGAVLYEALTGAPPFETPADSLPSSLRPQILRCLQPDRARRYGTATELAEALGIVLPAPTSTRPGRSRAARLAVPALLVVALAATGAVVWQRREAARRAADAAAAQDQAVTPSGPPRPARTVVAFAGFAGEALGDGDRWLGRGLREYLAAGLLEQPGLDVSRAALEPGAMVAAARRSGIDLVVEGRVEPHATGLWLDVKLLDVRTGALRFADRASITQPSELLVGASKLAGDLRRSIDQKTVAAGAAPSRSLPPLTKVNEAYVGWIRGLVALDAGDRAAAESALRQAATLDPAFFEPRAALAQLLRSDGRAAEAAPFVEQAKAALVASGAFPTEPGAGEQRVLTLRRLLATTPDQEISALLALRERYPRDAGAANELARAYRDAGRPADCVTESKRALDADPTASWAPRLIARCSFEAGDPTAALAAARKATPDPRNGDFEPLGELLLGLGKYGDAADRFRRAVDGGVAGAAAGVALVQVHGRGRCFAMLTFLQKASREPLTGASAEALARAWVTSSLACGQWPSAREAITWARHAAPSSGVVDELGLRLAAARNEAGTFARAKEAFLRSSRRDGLTRARRLAPLLAAARAEGKSAEALALVGQPQPVDRYAGSEPPLLFEVALTRIDAGATDDAALDCNELLAAAPSFAPGRYCLGRVAEAQQRWVDAFHAYRDFLDRWTEADEDNRLVRDAKRRLPRVIREARKPAPPAPATPPAPAAPAKP